MVWFGLLVDTNGVRGVECAYVTVSILLLREVS
jgi:hypothetical protein